MLFTGLYWTVLEHKFPSIYRPQLDCFNAIYKPEFQTPDLNPAVFSQSKCYRAAEHCMCVIDYTWKHYKFAFL